MNRILNSILILSLWLPSAHAGQTVSTTTNTGGHPVRILLVVAHPDDEYEMAGTVYRIAKELSGTVDQLILTDGEAGYRYSSLADKYYDLDLTDESVGRKQLPRIRKEEAERAARILGIRHQWFLNQKDEHFTLSAKEVLEKTWDQDVVLRTIVRHLHEGHYNFVFVLLPTKDTHGEHKAASILTLRAVRQIPAEQRPVVLGAQASGSDSGTYQPLSEYPLTATIAAAPSFHFDRDVRFGYDNSLSYQIVVDWVIAEHKSQGLFQTRCMQDRFENFWIFSGSGNNTPKAAESLFVAISQKPKDDDQARISKSEKAQ
jgi:N-acetylglucosamine malate deacetylase 2